MTDTRYTRVRSDCPQMRSNLHFQLQLLILPAIILALVAVLAMKGCAARPHQNASASDECSAASKAVCLCTTPGAVSFKVEDMACPNCAKELQEVLAAVPGVTGAAVCFKSARAFVTLDKRHPATMEAIYAAVAIRQEERLTFETNPHGVKSAD